MSLQNQVIFLCFVSPDDFIRILRLLQISHLEIPLCFPSLVLFCNIGSLVIEFFTLRQADFNLCPSVLKIDGQRHDGISVLGSSAGKLSDLGFMQKQFPRPIELHCIADGFF